MILPWFSLRKLNENYLQYNFNENLCIFIDMDKKIKGIILAKSSKAWFSVFIPNLFLKYYTFTWNKYFKQNISNGELYIIHWFYN